MTGRVRVRGTRSVLIRQVRERLVRGQEIAVRVYHQITRGRSIGLAGRRGGSGAHEEFPVPSAVLDKTPYSV
jgi:hypothetical protein